VLFQQTAELEEGIMGTQVYSQLDRSVGDNVGL
jgi:hypothetical protein